MNEQDCEQLTLFPADSLVSRLAVPGSEEARKTTVTSGLRCLELSKNSGPLGLLEKMLLESSQWRSTRCFLTWKYKATKQGRLLFQLAVSMPRTGETASPLWHTPNVPNGGRVSSLEMSPTGKMPDGKKRQVGLEHQVRMVERGLWPTPTTNDAKNSSLPPSQAKRKQLIGAVIRNMYATPQARDFRTGQASRWENPNRSRNLNDQVAQENCGQLNPTWVEWLMGFPLGWTDLNASETP